VTTRQEPPRRRASRAPRRISSSEAGLHDTATSTSSGELTTRRERAIESATSRSPIWRMAARLRDRKKLASAMSTFSGA
jgi:hypothetical protein